MPELPEVETVMRGMARVLDGARIAMVSLQRKDLRWPIRSDFAARLEGRQITNLRRRAKYILADLDSGDMWLTHLGMSGRILMTSEAPERTGKHDHCQIQFDNGWHLIFTDPRRFGWLDVFAQTEEGTHPRLANLGPEPLSNQFHAAHLAQALAGRKRAIKELLFDARIVVGLGNIYIAEALYHAGIHPQRAGGGLSEAEIEALTGAIRNVLKEAIEAGGSSLRDYRQSDGALGYFQHRWAVYGKEGKHCPDCTCQGRDHIQRIIQTGRSSFFCPIRQR